MCSSIFHIAFTLILAASTVVLLVAAFTPGWATEIYDKVNPNSSKIEKGLISVKCLKEKASGESTEDCDDFYVSLHSLWGRFAYFFEFRVSFG